MYGILYETCKDLYGYLFGGLEYPILCRILVWNKYLRYGYLMEWLFGLVVVLNGGKISIEIMLGFRGDVVHFVFNPCFCFGNNLAITHPN